MKKKLDQRSFKALMARGFDSKLAQQLVNDGYTISKLKSKTVTELKNLGIKDSHARELKENKRPPIPAKTVAKLLYESKFGCCICKDNKNSLIIHHIKKWTDSKDNSEDNLVVLCLKHHDGAHTKHELTLNLTPSILKEAKKKWINDVKANAARSINEQNNRNIIQIKNNKLNVGIDLYHGKALKHFDNIIKQNGFKHIILDHPLDQYKLQNMDILLIATLGMETDKSFNETEIWAIKNFVIKGGSLICADQAWSWVCPSYGNKPADAFPLNVLGKNLGFFITGKNVGSPYFYDTEVMNGIKNVRRKSWWPSQIEFLTENSQAIIRDECYRIIAGYLSLGDGHIIVVGHGDMLEENPELIQNILTFLSVKNSRVHNQQLTS